MKGKLKLEIDFDDCVETPDSGASTQYSKEAVDKYLEQIKILSALATALLISPNIAVALTKFATESRMTLPPELRYWLLGTNTSFLLTILTSYLIYSSIVGFIADGKYDIYRSGTRVTSLIQVGTMLVGCIGMCVVFWKIISL